MLCCCFQRYELPSDHTGWAGAKGRIHRSTAKLEWHAKAIGDLAVNAVAQRVASASSDGSLAVWRDDMSGNHNKQHQQFTLNPSTS